MTGQTPRNMRWWWRCHRTHKSRVRISNNCLQSQERAGGETKSKKLGMMEIDLGLISNATLFQELRFFQAWFTARLAVTANHQHLGSLPTLAAFDGHWQVHSPSRSQLEEQPWHFQELFAWRTMTIQGGTL